MGQLWGEMQPRTVSSFRDDAAFLELVGPRLRPPLPTSVHFGPLPFAANYSIVKSKDTHCLVEFFSFLVLDDATDWKPH